MKPHAMRACLPFLVLVLAGCVPDLGVSTGGQAGSGTLGEDLGSATAPIMVLDLASGSVRSVATIDAAAASLREGEMAFRRIGSGSDEFFIGMFEVTQAQWSRLAASTPWTDVVPGEVPAGAVGGAMPAFNLSYDAISTALASYNAARGTKLAVPTGAQWTSACAGSGTWWWGSTAGSTAQLATRAIVRESQGATAGPRAVGATAANSSGLHDLHGNVWEWTAPGVHVRGGSWFDPVYSARTDNLAGADPSSGIDSSVAHALVGVRLVLRL